MLISFVTFTSLPPPSKDSSHKSTFERLNAMAAEERSIKFLLRDEFLHQFGLLHPSRSTQPYEVPDSPAEAPDAPVSVEEPTLKDPAPKASLVKCYTSIDVAVSSGKFALAPVIEEEEPRESPQHSGKSGDRGARKTSLAK